MAVRVLIAGAGIAGLTTALSLHAAGIEALIVESALELKPMGAGINLLPHAVGELTELGLGGELEAAGIATSEQAPETSLRPPGFSASGASALQRQGLRELYMAGLAPLTALVTAAAPLAAAPERDSSRDAALGIVTADLQETIVN